MGEPLVINFLPSPAGRGSTLPLKGEGVLAQGWR